MSRTSLSSSTTTTTTTGGASSINQQSWLECAKWLDSCLVLTEQLRSRLRMNNLKLNEFSCGLRDGVILCNLLNYLSPGSIDSSQIARRSTQNRSACIKNIRLFLEACKKEFDLNDQLLFQADMLYDLNVERVFITLSTISKLKQVELKCNRSGFNIESNQNELENYYNIEPIDECDQMYTPDEAILDENDAIYQTIMHSGATDDNRRSGVGQVNFSKRDHVTREIYESETKFVRTLNIIVNDFMRQLSPILNENDKKIIFINIETLRNVHSELLDKLREAITGGHGRTSRICSVYDSYKLKLMKEYVDYFGGMQTAIFKVDNLTVKSNEFKNKLDVCRNKSEMGTFKLSDLIRIPYQRVLKYHLLFTELNKNTDEQHTAKKDIQTTLANMMDLAHYLNEAQRDKEILDQIDDINKNIQDFNFNSTTLRDFGHLVKDDNVRIKEIGERSAKTRTLLLFEKALFICKSRGDNYQYKGTLMLNDYKIEESGYDSNNNNASIQINLVLHNDRSKGCSLLFKDDKQKNDWKTNISATIDKLLPRGHSNNNHSFSLFNFERDIVNCSFCKKVLLGVFYQGYKCSKCLSLAHKGCILKFQQCSGTGRNSTGISFLQPFKALVVTSNDNRRIKFVSYKVRALYSYQGKPQPPDNDVQVLKFKENDIIQVTDDDDDDWWKGYKIGGSTTTEGCFPKNYVQALKSPPNYSERSTINGIETISSNHSVGDFEVKSIEHSSWYSACERESAETILNRVPNPVDVAIFLVRPRNEGGYAISIKFNSKVEHIRIHVLKFLLSDGRESANVCLVEQVQFPSIQDLIAHYMVNKLEDNFPQLKTTLGIPFRSALPPIISEAIAIHDYDAKRNSTGVEIQLVKDREYWVLSKDAMGWWKVYNSDGLIGYAPGNYLREI